MYTLLACKAGLIEVLYTVVFRMVEKSLVMAIRIALLMAALASSLRTGEFQRTCSSSTHSCVSHLWACVEFGCGSTFAVIL